MSNTKQLTNEEVRVVLLKKLGWEVGFVGTSDNRGVCVISPDGRPANMFRSKDKAEGWKSVIESVGDPLTDANALLEVERKVFVEPLGGFILLAHSKRRASN